MTVSEYIAIKQQQHTTMCAAILYPDGDIEACTSSHLQTMIDHLGSGIWDQIPRDESPLFWLTGYTGVVLIDYENQVYSEELSKAQRDALHKLYTAEVLSKHPSVIHFGNRALGIAKSAE